MISITTGSNSPTNVIMNLSSSDGSRIIEKDITKLSSSEKKKYNDFFNLVGLHSLLNIHDVDIDLDFSHVSQKEVSNEIKDVSLSDFKTTEVKKINAFASMVKLWKDEKFKEDKEA